MISLRASALLIALLPAAVACGKKTEDPIPSVPITSVPGHDSLAQDNSLKEGPRLVPVEAYLRTYLQIFGGLAPLQVQAAMQVPQTNDIFRQWTDYLAAMGLPDYAIDVPRTTQTSSIMLATFERLGVALCDKAAVKELGASPVALDKRTVFAFDATPPTDLAGFQSRFDVLHRTFLGYPAKLAPTDRVNRFWTLYQETAAAQPDAGATFTKDQAGWAAICYGLVRHPEFHLY